MRAHPERYRRQFEAMRALASRTLPDPTVQRTLSIGYQCEHDGSPLFHRGRRVSRRLSARHALPGNRRHPEAVGISRRRSLAVTRSE